MKDFKINEYLSVKLEGDETVIYVADQKFMTCKYLLFTIETEKVNNYDHIESIDEAIERYNQEHQFNKSLLSPETEFWGHCSNLQAWVEHDYDTRLLDMRLAFPLLKSLSDAGDLEAKKVFKEEIAKRIESGFPNVSTFLFEQGYFDLLSKEELEAIWHAEKVASDDEKIWIKISPSPVINTYGVGVPLWKMRKPLEARNKIRME